MCICIYICICLLLCDCGFPSIVWKDLWCLFWYVYVFLACCVSGTRGRELWHWGEFAPCKHKRAAFGAGSPSQLGFCPEARMPALSEIDLDFHSRAPDSRVECFRCCAHWLVLNTPQSSALENIAILQLGKGLKTRNFKLGGGWVEPTAVRAASWVVQMCSRRTFQQ